MRHLGTIISGNTAPLCEGQDEANKDEAKSKQGHLLMTDWVGVVCQDSVPEILSDCDCCRCALSFYSNENYKMVNGQCHNWTFFICCKNVQGHKKAVTRVDAMVTELVEHLQLMSPVQLLSI